MKIGKIGENLQKIGKLVKFDEICKKFKIIFCLTDKKMSVKLV